MASPKVDWRDFRMELVRQAVAAGLRDPEDIIAWSRRILDYVEDDKVPPKPEPEPQT